MIELGCISDLGLIYVSPKIQTQVSIRNWGKLRTRTFLQKNRNEKQLQHDEAVLYHRGLIRYMLINDPKTPKSYQTG